MDQDTDFKVEIIFSASAVDLLADRYGCGHKTIGKGSVADPELKSSDPYVADRLSPVLL